MNISQYGVVVGSRVFTSKDAWEDGRVILVVIPPGTTCKTGSDQADGTTDLTCEDWTRRDGVDGRGSTSNP